MKLRIVAPPHELGAASYIGVQHGHDPAERHVRERLGPERTINQASPCSRSDWADEVGHDMLDDAQEEAEKLAGLSG